LPKRREFNDIGTNGLAVDNTGHIFVADLDNNSVTSYKPDGSPTGLDINFNTLQTGLCAIVSNPNAPNNPYIPCIPSKIAVDSNGKIYVAVIYSPYVSQGTESAVVTFGPDGSPTIPTIYYSGHNVEIQLDDF
jgi:hypothetical protein